MSFYCTGAENVHQAMVEAARKKKEDKPMEKKTYLDGRIDQLKEEMGDLIIRAKEETRTEKEQKHVAAKASADVAGAVDMCARAILKRATGIYGHRIYDLVRDVVISDVKNCSAYKESGGFTQEDVQHAIGKELCKRLGIEV